MCPCTARVLKLQNVQDDNGTLMIVRLDWNPTTVRFYRFAFR